MVLLNQRIYYEKLAQEGESTTEVGTLEFGPGLGSRLHSEITNPDIAGEVSIIQLPEGTTQANFGRGYDDVESQRIRGNITGAAEK